MLKVREAVDGLEATVDDGLWPLPTYQELLFVRDLGRPLRSSTGLIPRRTDVSGDQSSMVWTVLTADC
jgi:hypothetical protein